MKKIMLLLTLGLMGMSAVQAAPQNSARPDMSKLCQGKAINSKIKTTMGDRQIEGTCQIGFKANHPDALERGAMREPTIQNACKGKAKGQAVTAKMNGKMIAGKCDIIFKGNGRR